MKFQWALLLGIAFALIVSVFAVINVEPVAVNYLFGEAEWPLILVILGSVLMGGIIVGSVGLFRMYMLKREVRALKKQNRALEEKLAGEEEAREGPPPQIEDIH
ncbi:lipopolysaccharide assembly protein LapA domain-containing protein [Bacillus sp. REN3]|uniref:LapA family protein n=1 Tax=Bacillus sp. REN3 TaxID=2802440 RepID=UPI001AEDB312|nr:lipopolysaccharide assembly protein LapA domain-containing protein [Bacillus sp. REN3]